MNSCMVSHATQTEEDAARVEWFAGRIERRKKREDDASALERRRQEVIEITQKHEEKERLADRSISADVVKNDTKRR